MSGVQWIAVNGRMVRADEFLIDRLEDALEVAYERRNMALDMLVAAERNMIEVEDQINDIQSRIAKERRRLRDAG